MDFSLDDEQTALREAVRGLLRGHFDKRSALIADEPGFDTGMWARFAEMGLLGLPYAEAYDGMGAGPAEVMLVAQELGRVLAPEPYVDVVVLAGGLIADAGSETQKAELLGAIARGELRPVLAHDEPAHAVTATRDGDAWTLSGTKEPVRHGGSADLLIVSADAGLFVVDPAQEGVRRTSYPTHDGARAARIDLDGAVTVPLGDAGPAEPVLRPAFARTQIALGAEALGAMEQALETTVEYLKTRKQFGVTLSKFQALTFRAADLYVSLELARSMVMWGTMALAADGPDPTVAARVALQVGRCGRHLGQEAIQLHGGIGMTDEYSIGHYASRLAAIERSFGTRGEHLAALASGIGAYDEVDLLR